MGIGNLLGLFRRSPIKIQEVPISLPLMGIGNGARLRILITPHGVSPTRRHRLGCGSVRLSLPLAQDRDQDEAGQLITPHGDRKRSRQTHCPHRSRSHYPSWGSETGCEVRAHSLPLMGIGNMMPQIRQCRISSDFSLPLMGIGNQIERPAPSPGLPQSHYPSWGSETRWHDPPHKSTHYPSWGSET